MYIVRDIFQLKFGHFKAVKSLFEEMLKIDPPTDLKEHRLLSDFTGDSYRLIWEQGYDSLAEYEKSLTDGMKKPEWQQWYANFKTHAESSHREILKVVL